MSSEAKQIANAVVIKDKKLLVVRSGKRPFFTIPGGSIEEGEEDWRAVIRELKEEVQLEVTRDDLEFLGEFEAQSMFIPGLTINMHVFQVKHYRGDPAPDNEIEEIKWITSSVTKDLKPGSITEAEIIPLLKMQGLVN